MATNTGKDYRKGAVRERTQAYNPATGLYVKRDVSTGKFIAVKKDGAPFKGVAMEERIIAHNPNIPKGKLDQAKKAVTAVAKHRKSK